MIHAARPMRPEIENAVLRSFLGDLTPREAEAVLGDAPEVRMPPGATVLGPDEARLWLVVGGLVRVFILTSEGRQQIMFHAVPGETIGLDSLFTEEGGIFAQTVVESRLLSLDWNRIHELLRSNPAANRAAAAEVVERSHRALETMTAARTKTVRQRIAGYVLDLLSRTQSPRPDVPLTQQELADAIGCSREAVSRSLAGLRRQGLVATEPAHLTVLRRDGLLVESGQADNIGAEA
jgi:CRP-like cAMP-binding protein